MLSQEDLCCLYQLADVLVFPSLKEGWGLVILEAIASGLPIITSNHAPFTEFLTPAQALLVDPQDPNAIADAMKRILEPTFAQALIQRSQSILVNYTWEKSAKMHLEQYQKLINQQK